MNTYEMMILFDTTAAASWEEFENEVNRLMTRAGAEVIVLRKLEERRLAFEIKGRKRGLYVLVYFRASGEKIVALERDARLSELILRALVLRADGISEELMRTASLGFTGSTSPSLDDPEGGPGSQTDSHSESRHERRPPHRREDENQAESPQEPELVASRQDDASQEES